MLVSVAIDPGDVEADVKVDGIFCVCWAFKEMANAVITGKSHKSLFLIFQVI